LAHGVHSKLKNRHTEPQKIKRENLNANNNLILLFTALVVVVGRSLELSSK
jgi:hypothetical protein